MRISLGRLCGTVAAYVWYSGGPALSTEAHASALPLLCLCSASALPLLCLCSAPPQYPDWPTLSAKFNELAPRIMSVDGAKNVLGLELVPAGIFMQQYYDPTTNKSNVNPIGTGARTFPFCGGEAASQRSGHCMGTVWCVCAHRIYISLYAARAAAVVGKPWGSGSS